MSENSTVKISFNSMPVVILLVQQVAWKDTVHALFSGASFVALYITLVPWLEFPSSLEFGLRSAGSFPKTAAGNRAYLVPGPRLVSLDSGLEISTRPFA